MKKFLSFVFKPTLNLFDIICYVIIMPLSIHLSWWYLLLFIPAWIASGHIQIMKLGFRVTQDAG